MRFHCYSLAILGAMIVLVPPAQAADKYPVRPVRMIVPYPPGGGSDLTGRAIAQKLNDSLGQTIVVDNRPGATGLIGTELAAKSPANGYTIILADAPHTINALVYAKQRYDAIRDFEPINLLATSPQALLAHPSFSANSLKELLAMPRAQTEKIAMCGPLASPLDPMAIFSVCARGIASSSFSVLPLNEGWASSAWGEVASRLIGSKSRIAS